MEPVNQEVIEEKLRGLFFPYAMSRLKQAQSNSKFRFAHYTSAETGMKILQNREVWLRTSSIMNDFSEVHHGQDCLLNAWSNTDSCQKLKEILKLLDPKAVDQFTSAFDEEQYSRTKQSYIVSLSEHGDQELNEDEYGRLSMWRAYGGKTNIAFIFNSKPFFTDSTALNAYTSPVLYADKNQYAEHFKGVVDGLADHIDLLKDIGWQEVFKFLFAALRYSVLSTKHPGFSEEREWRVIYSPQFISSERIKEENVTLDGIPQKIYKIPLENLESEGLFGIEIPELLDKIIIGPTEFPLELKAAFVEQLAASGVENPQSKVIISGIPLRR